MVWRSWMSRVRFIMSFKGFTLIEMLVAMFIVAVAGLSIQTSFSKLLDQQQMIKDRNSASLITWNVALTDFFEIKSNDKVIVTSTINNNKKWALERDASPTLLGDVIKKEVKVINKTTGSDGVSLVFYH